MLRAAVEKNNPARQAHNLPDVPIVLCHGLNDTAVPIADHSLALARLVPVELHTNREGHSTQSFGMYDTPLIADVLHIYTSQEE